MTMQVFLTLFGIFATLTGLMTEAIKQWMINKETDASKNLISLINAVVIGGGGTVCAYIIMEIPFNAIGIIGIIGMIFGVWLGAMLGFDKIRQMAEQLKKDSEREREESVKLLADAIQLNKEKNS